MTNESHWHPSFNEALFAFLLLNSATQLQGVWASWERTAQPHSPSDRPLPSIRAESERILFLPFRENKFFKQQQVIAISLKARSDRAGCPGSLTDLLWHLRTGRWVCGKSAGAWDPGAVLFRRRSGLGRRLRAEPGDPAAEGDAARITCCLNATSTPPGWPGAGSVSRWTLFPGWDETPGHCPPH